MKLFTKYSRVNLLMIFGVFLLSGLVFYSLVNYILIREMDADLDGIRHQVLAFTAQHHRFPDGHPLDEEQISFKEVSATATSPAFDSLHPGNAPSGSIPAANTSPGNTSPGNTPPENAGSALAQPAGSRSQLVTLYSPREKKMHNFRQLIFPLQMDGKTYEVTIAKPLEGLHHLSRVILIVSLSTLLLTILVALLINRLLMRRLWQPFYDAIDTMRRFKLGKNQPIRFPPTTIDEFAFMNEQLRLATEKADQDYLLLKEFTENASHEIQTPLSIIRSKLDLLIQQEELSQRQSEIVQSAYAAIRKLSRLNQSLLLLAKIGNQQFNNVEWVPLKEKIEEKILQFQELWHTGQVKASCNLENSGIHASPELIDILLNNLLSNASNHNVPQGSIRIILESNRLAISNTGQSALDESRIFTRFYKGEQHTGRNGLGLSIIKQICEVSAITPAYRFAGGQHEFSFEWRQSEPVSQSPL